MHCLVKIKKLRLIHYLLNYLSPYHKMKTVIWAITVNLNILQTFCEIKRWAKESASFFFFYKYKRLSLLYICVFLSWQNIFLRKFSSVVRTIVLFHEEALTKNKTILVSFVPLKNFGIINPLSKYMIALENFGYNWGFWPNS